MAEATADSGRQPLAPRYVSVADLATYASVHVNTVRRLIKSGQLPAHRVGGRVLVDLAEFDRWMQARRIAG